MQNEQRSLLSSHRFRSAKSELLLAVADSSKKIRALKPTASSPETREEYLRHVQEFNRQRGRDLYYPFIASGLGSGPYIELADGSVKLDMITGIGINFFG